MFTVARTLVKNKVVIVALLIACYFVFAGNKEAPKPKSAWDTVPTASASSTSEPTMTDRAIKLINAGAKYAGVEEYLPTSLQEQAVGGFEKTGAALDKINSGQE